jgi:hypothetical protein
MKRALGKVSLCLSGGMQTACELQPALTALAALLAPEKLIVQIYFDFSPARKTGREMGQSALASRVFTDAQVTVAPDQGRDNNAATAG